MTKIIDISDYSKNKTLESVSYLDSIDQKASINQVVSFVKSSKRNIDDVFMLWIPDKNDLKKFQELKDQVWKKQWYEYLLWFVKNILIKNYSMNPDNIPFFIKTNLNKCSSSEIIDFISNINIEIKRQKLPINTKQFLLNLRNIALQKNKEINS